VSSKRKRSAEAAPTASERVSRPRRKSGRRRRPSKSVAERTEELEAGNLGIGSRMVPPPTLDETASDIPERAPERALEPADVQEEIRALEERLDGMIRRASERTSEAPPATLRNQVGTAARDMADRLGLPGGADATRELFTSDYFLRQWGRLSLRNRSEDVDDFGLDPTYERRIEPVLDFLYKHYFRVTTTGVEHVPDSGRCIVVANHSGTLPIDGLMLRSAVRLRHPTARELRWLAEDFIFYLPFAGAFFNRIGAVRACQENAERLLKKGSLVAVFPEGIKGIKKLYKDRYRLQRFGRGGFIRLCLRTQTPLIPCAVIGAEETNPMLYRIEYLSKALGLPYVPVTPTFPLLGPLGIVPAPSKWLIQFGEPIRFDGYGPEAADDHVLVGRLSERVRAAIQDLLDRGLKNRHSVWFG
jgi:1-acyl-sn-glycerol-3-phosphate acyltransferase